MLRTALPIAIFLVSFFVACGDKQPPAHVSIHLDDTYDSTRITNDLQFLQSIDGVQAVTFVSKDKAKEIYLQGGGESWEGILDENPLPASFEADLKKSILSEKERAAWEENIRNNIHGTASFNWSVKDEKPAKE